MNMVELISFRRSDQLSGLADLAPPKDPAAHSGGTEEERGQNGTNVHWS